MASCRQQFLPKQHIRYFRHCLTLLPDRFSSLDSSRLTVAFFALSGLELLNALDEVDRKQIIEWIYHLQVSDGDIGGFEGSTTFLGISDMRSAGHIAMTYTGIATLLSLGDDLSRVKRTEILRGVRALQREDGSYCASLGGSESDMRFLYCAACICCFLHDTEWIGMDRNLAAKYITDSISYEGAMGQGPGLEAHGGSTYCAVAALVLMGEIDSVLTESRRENLKRWCIFRQDSTEGGFQGRPNKSADTCYSFWVGATLKLLDSLSLSNPERNSDFLMKTQDPISGGLAKWMTTLADADPLHSYLGLAGLSLLEYDDIPLIPVHPALNISVRSVKRLEEIHKQWSNESSLSTLTVE